MVGPAHHEGPGSTVDMSCALPPPPFIPVASLFYDDSQEALSNVVENALKFCKMGRSEGGKDGGDRATVVLRARFSTKAEWGAGRWERARAAAQSGMILAAVSC